jgi:hypothetical protein
LDQIPYYATPSPSLTLHAQHRLSASHLTDFPAGQQTCVKGFPSGIGRELALTHQSARTPVMTTVGLQETGDRVLLHRGDQLRVALPDMNGDGWSAHQLTGSSLRQLGMRRLASKFHEWLGDTGGKRTEVPALLGILLFAKTSEDRAERHSVDEE